MSSIDTNTVFLTGRLGSDPELKHSATGAPYVRLSVAVHKVVKQKPEEGKAAGDKITQTQWHRVMVWGHQAELCSRFMRKGSTVLVEGHLDSHTYVSNGAKKGVVQVVGERVQFMGSRFGAVQTEKDLDLGALDHIPDVAPDPAAIM